MEIELTKNSRLVVETDIAPLPVRNEGEHITGTYTPHSWWGHSAEGPDETFSFPGDIERADRELFDGSAINAERNIQRWAWLAHGLHLQRVGATYWFCDRAAFEELHGGEFSRENQRSVISDEVSIYTRWLNREAKVITLQRFARFRRTTTRWAENLTDVYEFWEPVKSVADVYLDDNVYTPAAVAHENFWDYMTPREKSALAGLLDAERALP